MAKEQAESPAPAPMIHKLIAGVMGEMGAVGKNKQFDGQGRFQYRGIEDVVNALKGPLENAALYYVPEVLDRERFTHQTKSGGTLFYTFLRVKFTIYAPDGSSVFGVTCGEGMDSSDKSTNKAMSAAQKYFLCQVFHLATADMVEPEDADHGAAGIGAGRPAEPQTPGPAPAEYAYDALIAGAPPPAAPAPANGADPLEDNSRFAGELERALKARGFKGGTDRDAAVAAICNRAAVPALSKLGLKSRHQALSAIAAGKLDKYKSPAAARPAPAARTRR